MTPTFWALVFCVLLAEPVLPSVCVVSYWESWGPCVGDCAFSLAVRNRDVVRPPFPERIKDGRLAIRPCPVLYQVQTCSREACEEEAASSRRTPRLHKFGAPEESPNVAKAAAPVPQAAGVAHKAPTAKAVVKTVVQIPSWQAGSFRGREFRANETADPFPQNDAVAFAAAKPTVGEPTTTEPSVEEESSTAYYVANITKAVEIESESMSFSADAKPIASEVVETRTNLSVGGVPRARFSLLRRPGEEFVPLHSGAAAITVPGQTKRPIALGPTTTTTTSTTTPIPSTRRPTTTPTTTTTTSTTTTTTTTTPVPKTTPPITTLPTTTLAPTTVAARVVVPSKSETSPSVVTAAPTRAHEDVVRTAMEVPRSHSVVGTSGERVKPDILFTRIEAGTTIPATTRTTTAAPTTAPTTARSSVAPRQLPTKGPFAGPLAPSFKLPKQVLVGHIPSANSSKEEVIPVARTKITILGPPNRAIGPAGATPETPIFLPKFGTDGAEATTTEQPPSTMPVFRKRSKANRGSLRKLRWWEVLNLTPKPTTLAPTPPPPTTTDATTATSTVVATSGAPVLRILEPHTSKEDEFLALTPDDPDDPNRPCGVDGANPRCCRPAIRAARCPNGRRPQRVVRWGRSASDRECVPYNYAYCGYSEERADGRPLKFEEDCYSGCFSAQEKASLPIFPRVP